MHARKEFSDLSVASLPSDADSTLARTSDGAKRSGFARLEQAIEELAIKRSPSGEPVEGAAAASSSIGPSTLLVVRTAAPALEQLAEHARRKLDEALTLALGRAPRVVFVSGAHVDEPWHELSRYVSSDMSSAVSSALPTALPTAIPVSRSSFPPAISPGMESDRSPSHEASPREIAERILASGADALVVVEPVQSGFGRAVFAHLAEAAELAAAASSTGALTLLHFTLPATSKKLDTPFAARCEVIDVDARLEREEVRAWWRSLTRDFDRLPNLDRLDALSNWWRAAAATPADAPAPSHGLSPVADRLLARLSLAGRAWPVSALSRLGARESQASELVSAGLAVSSGELVTVSPAGGQEATSRTQNDDFVVVGRALQDLFPEDPWAIMRAAELRGRQVAALEATDPVAEMARIEAMAMRAISSVIESETRDDLWRRYRALVVEISGEGRAADVASCLRTADLALRIGDVDRAVEFSRMAASVDGDSSDVLLTLGRATAATGDLTTAGVTIAKAMQRCAEATPAWARAAVELAEVRYTTGDLAEASELAEKALVATDVPSVRLAARNVQGKILLAKAAYADADLHFAGDACDAACAGESVAELRARLNRAIALMSASRLDEARAMLESVLELGEQRAEVKAVCFALGNLATIAILQHRYAEALALLERTIDIVRRIGDKPRLALFITNLAELRLRLGLDREAEQLLLFGRRVCGVTSPRFAQFSLVSARIQLGRGRTVEAMRDVATAMAGSGVSLSVGSVSTDPRSAEKEARGWSGLLGMLVLECLRVAARAALEDGDTRRASEFIERATHENGTPRAKAEVVTLRAACARAGGETFSELADDALTAARESDDEDLIREAHLLAHHAALSEDDRRRADFHLDAAITLRDQVAESLPLWIRERYLQRHDLAELARLEADRNERLRAAAAARESYRPDGLLSARPESVRPEGARSEGPRSEARGEISSRADALGKGRKIVGSDPSVKSLLAAIQKVGRSETTVLVHGESGTGKELVAEALHEASPRASGPMVKVNCAALVETLLLSELFGHEKGAFTGAAGRRRGRFEAADGGTLFLDEIGDISPRTQVALLRVLQEKTFERVGGTASIRANVRVVCATHRDLKALVARGEFREDLYYRLCGVVLEVPALRARLGDLGVVADALLRRIADERGGAPKTLSAGALSALKQHTWPGNIRELENALRAASLFAEGAQIEVEDFTENVESLRVLALDELGTAPAASESVAGRSSTSARAARVSFAGLTGSDEALAAGPATARSRAGEAEPSSAGAAASPSSAGGSAAGSAAGSPTDVAYAHVRAGVSLSDMKKQIERDCIARALTETDGNITRAATLLGMKRPRLSQLVKQYGLGGDGENWAGDSDDEGEEA